MPSIRKLLKNCLDSGCFDLEAQGRSFLGSLFADAPEELHNCWILRNEIATLSTRVLCPIGNSHNYMVVGG